jgi:pimeloyl-ACP methyl ester carboxylesterase
MNGRRALVAAAAFACTGCASAGVTVTGAHELPPPTVTPPTTAPDRSAPSAPAITVPTITVPTITVPNTLPGDHLWTACANQPAPWQCATVTVPLDYDHPTDHPITLRIVRLPAADPSARIGPLVLNPGGPGASGIELAFNEAQSYPRSVLDHFDIVGFDPRGVGQSAAVHCPRGADPDRSYEECIPGNEDLLPFLGTPNAARDIDRIRDAIGEQQISYLGYSYGTALGAVYADLFPDRLRAMVLDGAIDPDAGRSNTGEGGIDFYADQDFDGAIAEFERYCDLTPQCPAGPHTEDLIRRVRKKLADLPTDTFPGGGHLTRHDLDDVLTGAMYSAFDWPALAIALDDADNGDASTLAALDSWLLYGYPADRDGKADSEFANIAIRCADFSNRGHDSYECEHFPVTDEALPVITATDVSTPILVVGTKGDPATPARYAPQMAEALRDAVAIEWEGAGHTAVLTSRCITDLAADYLVDLRVPLDGTTCSFVTGVTDERTTAERIFGDPPIDDAADNIAAVEAALGRPADVAQCVGDHLARLADARVILDAEIGIDSPELVSLRRAVLRMCGG